MEVEHHEQHYCPYKSGSLSPCEDTGKDSLCEPGSGSSPDTESVGAMTLDMFSAFRMVRNKVPLCISTQSMVVCYSSPREQDKCLTEKKKDLLLT